MRHLRRITTVTDPQTGKVYPIPAGAEDGDGGGDGDGKGTEGEGSGDGDGGDAEGSGDGTAGDGGADTKSQQTASKPPWGSDEEFDPEKAWKLIQNLRGDVDELKPKAAKLKELEDADKTEAQRAAERAAEAEKRAAEAEAQAAKLEAAVKHGLTEEDLDLLGTGTPEEIAERAEKLAARLGSSQERPLPPSSRRQGRGGSSSKLSAKEKGLEEARRRFGEPAKSNQ
ncbi:MAG: hypothetical protein KY469_10740 [Actinobacteria bacterium]|nr:hypothetical protein [Actinomycetota bacterium]